MLPVYSTSDGYMVTLVKEHAALPANSYTVSTVGYKFDFFYYSTENSQFEFAYIKFLFRV